MTQAYNFSALLEEAQKEGIGGSLLPVGPGQVIYAKIVKVSASQGGKDQIGIMWQVLEGPNQGQTSWENQTISPENPKAMAAFFGWAKKFGMDNAFFNRQPQPSLLEIASVIDQLVVVADIGLGKPWGANKDKVDNTFRITEVRGKVGSVPTAQAPAAVAPVAAPAPVVPVAAPVAPVAPVAVQAVPVVAEPGAATEADQAAAFAAWQAQQAAAAPLPAAPAALVPVAVAPVAAPVAVVPTPEAAVDASTGLPVRSF